MLNKSLHILRRSIFFLIIFNLLFAGSLSAQKAPQISNKQFRDMSLGWSEEGGWFASDNWITNEMAYLEVLDDFDEFNIKGGVYLGVAASQNFSYIAKIKPEIAFFVDIRQQNRMQHYVYKEIFDMADNRIDFISLLISKPVIKKTRPNKNAGIEEIIEYFYTLPSSFDLMDKTTQKIVTNLKKKYDLQLDEESLMGLEQVMEAFSRFHLDIRYSSSSRMMFPTWAEVLMARDYSGQMKNFLNSNEDYAYLRKLQKENRIIPLTGNFGGEQAIRKIGEFSKKHKLPLTAFYVSNVEEYLLKNRRLWDGWINNLKSLPLTENSVIIRWTHEYGLYLQETRLQSVLRFIELDAEGSYYRYRDLIYTEYKR